MITCQYCGKENSETAKTCWRCGAPKPEEDPVIKGNPFYYRGYMVWPEKKYDRAIYHFWLGPQYFILLMLNTEV